MSIIVKGVSWWDEQSPEPVYNQLPEPVYNKLPKPVYNKLPEPVYNKLPNLQYSNKRKSYDNFNDITKNIKGVTQENIKEVTQENIKEVTQENIKEVTQENIKEVTQENIKEVTQENIKEDTKENIKEDTKENIKKATTEKIHICNVAKENHQVKGCNYNTNHRIAEVRYWNKNSKDLDKKPTCSWCILHNTCKNPIEDYNHTLLKDTNGVFHVITNNKNDHITYLFTKKKYIIKIIRCYDYDTKYNTRRYYKNMFNIYKGDEFIKTVIYINQST